MNLDFVQNNLNLSQIVFKSVILDNNAKVSASKISWDGYSPGIGKGLYVKEFEQLVDDRQFTYLLIDSSLIQIYYEYLDNGIIKYKLAYYPVPIVKKISAQEVEGYFDEATNDIYMSYYDQLIETFGDEILYTNSNHLRFDFDSKVNSHFKNHIQFGGINDVRIPMKFFVLPFTFIDFIIRNIYPDLFLKIIEKPAYKALKATSNYFELDNLNGHDSLYIHKDF